MNDSAVKTMPQRAPRWVVGLVVLGGVLGGVGGWLAWRELPAPPAPSTVASVSQAPAPPPEPPLPPAAQTDALLRERLAGASSAPEFAAWLREQDLLRRFVALVSNVASGDSPRSVVGFLSPAGGFQTRKKAGREFIDRKSYARYDVLGRVVGSLDAKVLVSTYQEVRELAERIHRESAPPGATFEATLQRAFAQVLAVPVLDGDVEVVARGGLYVYADPAHEGLTAAQKHLLRMGPANLRLIQEKVREVSQLLEARAARP
jgi:hypothetical protein